MTALTKYGALLAIVLTVSVLHAEDNPPKLSLSNAQMQTDAARIDQQLKTDYREMLELKARATKQKDVIKVNCVNTRLVEVKAHMNLADLTQQQLSAALLGNADNRVELYGKLVGSADNVARLRDEARNCVGESEMFKQESGVEVTKPDLPDDPTIDHPFEDGIEPPAYASPFF